MRKWIGTVCILLGISCLLGAVGLVLYNRWEARNAGQITQSLLDEVQAVIHGAGEETETLAPEPAESTDVPEPTAIPMEMDTVKVDGDDCIGILSIPVLELELPILTDWSYAKLRKAPCHYYGSYYEKNFVIAAHFYEVHFGRLSDLLAGDLIVFTDVNDVSYYYEVVLLETLPREATMEMITSGFDLSLYTCTPDSGQRVTVRCNRITANP